MKVLLFACILALSLFLQDFAKAEEEKSLSQEGNKISFLLPINWADKQCNLQVSIPEGYQAIQPSSQWEKSPIIEFIPKGEKADNWSEIITISKLVGSKISAEEMIGLLKNAVIEKNQGKVWQEKISKEPLYQFALLGISYKIDDRQEVLGCRYYSGPYDCVGVQYAIEKGKDVSEKELISKIDKFFEENTKTLGCETK